MAARGKFKIVAPEKDGIRVNERIRVREVRVIGADAEQLGVMTPEDALAMARELGLDLVEVAATSKPPVCRIMDYGRYKYEQKKKKGQKKQGHVASLKEIKLRPGTDLHDLDFKLSNARKFLMEGDKVKVTVMFRGREMVHTQRGRDQLQQVMVKLTDIAKMENPPRMEGRFMSMILVADRDAVVAAKREQKKSGEVVETAEELSRRERRRLKASAEAQAAEEARQRIDDDETEEAEKEDAAG